MKDLNLEIDYPIFIFHSYLRLYFITNLDEDNNSYDLTNVNLDEILFVWDAVFPEWNDYPPYTIWVDSVKVNSVEHTKEIIRRLIEGEEMDEEWLYGE